MIHELKILPQYFKEVISGSKTFEIRKNDRNFCIGDRLVLKEWENGQYTGRTSYQLQFQPPQQADSFYQDIRLTPDNNNQSPIFENPVALPY